MFKQISALFLITSFAFAAHAVSKTNTTLQKLSNKYRSAKLVEMSVEKTVKLELQGRETKYQGKIFLANGKFRWENETPEKTLLVFDGTTIWSVQYPPKEFGGNPQIAKGKVDKKTRSQILISSLLGGDLQKSFKVVNEKSDGDNVLLEVSPTGSDLMIKSMNLVVDGKKSLLKEISYKDDIGNLTTMKFSDIKFKDSANNSLFKYQPPKNVPVTEL
ncbi:MAG: outer membrane lipoprotein carrier protein LolA [Bdellovibrio sp.]|nr:outer membrane lipoprotein carrier protein LolA [Bdellovibrio sp.]